MDIRPGYKQTDVGVIPKDWQDVLLDSVAKRGSGHTPDKKHPEYWNGKIKWISLADSPALDRGFIDDTTSMITPKGIANSSAVLYPAGTVVLSRDAGVGKSAIMRTEMAVSQHFMAWRCGPELENLFLYYWLQAAKPRFERIANGTTIKTIGLPYFKDLKIPHPPLPEQRAIAAALSDMDALLEGLDRLIVKKRNLKQAVMQRLLTGRVRLPGFPSGKFKQTEAGSIPEDWEAESFARLFTFSNGVNAEKAAYGKGLRFVNVLEPITYSHLYGPEIPGRVSLHDSVASIYTVKKGDVLFNRTSETDADLGLAATFLGADQVVFGGFVIRARPTDDRLDPQYSGFALRAPAIRSQIIRMGQGAIRANIGQQNLKMVVAPLPSKSEQEAIAGILMDMGAELAALEEQKIKTSHLKQAMMQKLLTGNTRLVSTGDSDV